MKKNRHKKSGRGHHVSKAPSLRRMDPRAAEAVMWSIERKMNDRVFESAEEAQAFMKEVTESQDSSFHPETPLDEAQAIVYEAFDKVSQAERIRLSKKALEISADCADAYVLLAEEASNIDEAGRLYELGVQAGRRAVGDLLEREKGHVWGYVRTRPYMRARKGLADTLILQMDYESAALHYRDLLELDLEDTLGALPRLLECYLYLEQYENALNLIKEWGDDELDFAYAKAFIWFRKRGDVPLARRYADDAMRINDIVPALLYDLDFLKALTPKPGHPSPRVEDAGNYVERYSVLWATHPEAYTWLIEQWAKKLRERLPEGE